MSSIDTTLRPGSVKSHELKSGARSAAFLTSFSSPSSCRMMPPPAYAGCAWDMFFDYSAPESFLVTRSCRPVGRHDVRPRLRIARCCVRYPSASQKRNTRRRPRVYFFFLATPSSLCGLCMGHVFWLHRSGIVFVPSIMSESHSLQRAPVGRALIAFLHLG